MSRSPSRFVLGIALVLPTLCFAADPAWPSRPVTIITPGDAGGVLDIRARWLAERLAPLLGQSVIVDNRPGSGGSVGTQAGAKSPADGHTLTLIHLGTMAINPHLYARLGYDPLADFIPITRISGGPQLLVVHPSVKAGSLAELISLAKAQPGQLNFGSAGIGTPGHLAGELFKRSAALDVVHVPYKGGAQAVSALLAGQITFMAENPSVLLQHVASGRLRALAFTGPTRLKSLPEVPTTNEAGSPELELVAWTGLAVPAGTPKPVVDRIYREVRDLMTTPKASEWLELIGSYPRTDSPETFARVIRDDHAKWGKVIRDAGIRLE
ncbi:MAG: tripartite tricarboxylate transporter substrate binding protein [Chitinophagaceae bacterium]|nr:tripartite tricarboxylate transporter substrate binding protein [Rubrivivax sp.]